MNDFPIADLDMAATDSVQMPEPFSYDKWIDWHSSMITFLKGKKNVTKNVPLVYVICKEPNPINAADMTEEDEIIYHTSHRGAAYTRDNKQVHSYLTELTNGTDADQWVKDHRRTQDGRAAWYSLCNHYNGPGEGDKRVTIARSDITLVHYRNEASFSFEKYSTRLRKAFKTLETYGQPKCHKEQVEILLNQINTNNTRLVSTIAICRDSHSGTFDEACTYLSKQITAIFPQHQPNAFGKKGRGGQKSRYRQVSAVKRGKNGKVTCNGIDISDTTRYYTKEEFDKIGKDGCSFLNKCPKRKASKAKFEERKNKKPRADNENNRHVAAIINGVMQASRHERDADSVSPSIPSRVSMPQHGPHAWPPATQRDVNAITQGSANSQASSRNTSYNFDHNGNIIPN